MSNIRDRLKAASSQDIRSAKEYVSKNPVSDNSGGSSGKGIRERLSLAVSQDIRSAEDFMTGTSWKPKIKENNIGQIVSGKEETIEEKYLKKYSPLSYKERKDRIKQLEIDYDIHNRYGNITGMESTKSELDWLKDNSLSLISDIEEYDLEIKEAEKLLKDLEISDGVYDASQYIDGVYIGAYSDERKAAERELQQLKEGRYNAENQAKYNSLEDNADYKELSQKGTQKKRGDLHYNYINDIDNARKAHIGPEGQIDQNLYKYDFMTDTEVSQYNYLYNVEGKDAAEDYLDYISITLDERRMEKVKEDAEAAADESGLIASAASVVNNAFSGLGLISTVGDTLVKSIKEGATGEYAGPVNYNSPWMDDTVKTSTIRETVSQNLADQYGSINLDEKKHPILSKVLNGKSLGDVYQLGMSMVDSTVNRVLYPVIGELGTVLLAGSAGSQGVLDAVAKGANEEEAMKMGILNGAFEWVFERVSLENLLKGDARTTIGAILKQGGIEASEEAFTSIGNFVADVLVMAEKSDYRSAVQSYMEAGVSEEEAVKMALFDKAIEIGWDAIGGFLSGGIMGGGQQAVNNAYENARAKKDYGDSLKELVDEAIELNPDNELAKKIRDKIAAGGSTSGRNIRKLVEQNESAMIAQDKANIQSRAFDRLNELGETGDAHRIAYILAKRFAGEKITSDEEVILRNSKYGIRVSSELNPENVRSGEYSSRWVHDIGTERINVDEYNAILKAAQNEIRAQETAESEITLPARETDTGAAVEVPAAEETDILTEDETIEADDISDDDLEMPGYENVYNRVVEMAKSGVPMDYASEIEGIEKLSDEDILAAYSMGTESANTDALDVMGDNLSKRTGKTGRKVGTVKGEGVSLDEIRETFNDTQKTAYKLLSSYAEATGVDIVLYRSGTNENGEYEGAQGKFKWEEDTIYIDINAGLRFVRDGGDLAKYTMLRTFAHEFTHFIEKHSPVEYNNFRKLVFEKIAQNGENVNDLIEAKMKDDASGELTYEMASREVVAEAMTDILPDTSFMEELAQKHQNIFQKLIAKLKEFLEDLRLYFNSLASNNSPEANALKEQVGESVRYFEDIVKAFDKIAIEAVENYQAIVATEEQTETITETAEEETQSETEAKETLSENGYTIRDNLEYSSVEITFNEKPPKAVLDALKAKKFRWNKKKGVWYGKSTHEDISQALNQAYSEAPAESDFEKAFKAAPQEERDEVVAEINKGMPKAAIKAEIHEDITPKAEEVKENGTEEDTGRDLSGDRSDGQRTSGILDEVEAGAVLRAEETGDAKADPGERRGETGRDDNLLDAERDERGHGEGSSESRDLRRDDGLKGEDVADISVGDKVPEVNAEERSEKGEELHKEVAEQIERQSTETPEGRNFVISESLDLPKGEKARYKANVDAIRLVKKLEAEGRYATEAEQEILSKYVGWGGLSSVFDERKADWQKEYKELKRLLTPEEYALARGSTLNAHYTDISVIKAMYDGLRGMGFDGGRMMEPSSGTGNFVGAMPGDMSSKVKSWTMVELDTITGLIAKYLYPNADVRIQGFEKANIPNNYMDVAISNVPFGNYPITDKAYPKKVTSAIHNYFFAKTLDKVRPGGIVMFITSSYTMNSKDSTVRRYMMQKADLLGAIRLPDTAFKGNAGTEVVTDIIILKKRADNTDYQGENFLEAPYQYIDGFYGGTNINKYFLDHPEMVLGKAEMTGGMYRANSLTYKAYEDRGSLADQIREAFSHIEGKMDYDTKVSPEKTNFAVERASKKTKENGLVVKEGKVYQNKGGNLEEVAVPKGAAARIEGMLLIRDAAKELMTLQQQGVKEAEIKKARQKLNKTYDAFVKTHGFLNSQANKNAIKDDPDKFSVLALENYNADTKKATKSDIFTKNTVAPNRTVTSAKDVAEGLIVSINQTGRVDTSLIARLTGKQEADVTRELIDTRMAFKNRDGDLEPAETYLSGNVRAKLRDAEGLSHIDPDYKNNVEALKNVMPEDVSYEDIYVTPGTPWIPDSVYSDFAAYMLGTQNTDWNTAVEITHNKDTGNYVLELKSRYLKTSSRNTQKWGTTKRSFLDLFEAMLNSKSVVIRYKTEDGKSVIDKDATAAANEKIENIQKEFQDWLWRDEERREDLTHLYNETFNAVVTPKYNGDNLTVNGANAEKPLRPHQRNAVQRVIASGGNTLLAHKVGAGKTYEMAASAMKLKELGLVKKPMFAVPKSLVAQWGKEFIDFFPTAKLLVAEATDFTASNRKVFMNRIANGDYDAVIVSYEQFEKLPMSAEFTRELYQEQIDSIVRAIEEAKAEKGGKSLSVKDLEKKRKSLQAKIDKLTDTAKDEDNIDFEQLGVDSLFIDEAHNFKNLFYTTSMTNVSGLGNKDGSKRAFDLYTKVRYLQKLNGGRGIVFATATPVMNSMSEMYIMQKYLQPDLLDQLGLSTFDAWAKQFGEVVNGVEIKPSGQGYRVKQSFSRFKNMSELQLLFRNFADVLTDIPGLKIPKMKGGKVNVVVCEPGEYQTNYMKELEKRADNIKNVDPSVDNMLKITSDGRKISYTQRMIDPTLPYEEGCKIYRCADNVVKAYTESKDNKGTQLIFCDMATPKGKSSTTNSEAEETETDMESARLYDDIRARLMEFGIPKKEIAFIHDADTDAKKKKLFQDVNDGKVRVLIGSTGKMGVGMNAQKRIVAIHHLDAPWRPGDVEQRNGRAYRQGNINDKVECFTYVTEGSFDARLWDILERKQSFINQVMNGENVGREIEDTGEVTLSAAEVKALASGSPLILEQVQLETDIKKLESLRRAHTSAVYNAKRRMEADISSIAAYEKRIAAGEKDVLAVTDTYSEGKFKITVGNKVYTDKKEAGTALMAEATAKATESGYTTIGSFAGFELRVVKTHEGIKGLISGNQGYSFNTYPGNTTYMINHLISKIEGLSWSVNAWKSELTSTRQDLSEQEKLISEPFNKEAELNEKRARYNEIMAILNPKEEQSLDSDTVQEQSRGYLDEEKYSYQWFVDKPDMKVTTIDNYTPKSRAEVVQMAKKNAAIVGNENSDGSISVFVEDIGTDVVLATAGLRHGLDRRFSIHAPVTIKAGDILKNSIRLNEMTPTKREADSSYVLIGAAQNENGELFVVRSVINTFSNELATMDVLYAINAKKEPAALLPRITDSSATFTDSNISIAKLLDYVNQYFPDILPASVLNHYGHTIRPAGEVGERALYQQRTYTLSDREVLEAAANEISIADLTEAERGALEIFKNRLSKLQDLEAERAEQGRLYREQQFGTNVNRAEAEKTLNRMKILDGQIERAALEVLSVEEKTVLKNVLQKARRVVEQQERTHSKEQLKRWRDRRNNAAAIKKYRERIRADVNDLSKWVLHPNNKDAVRHIPDVVKNAVIPFLTSIDFTSKQQLRGGNATKADREFIKQLQGLKSALKQNIDVEGLYSGYNDLPPDFMDRLQDFIDTTQGITEAHSGDYVINLMTAEELQELSRVVKTLKTFLQQMNRFHTNAMFSHVYEAGDNTIEAMGELKDSDGKTGNVSNFVFWQQIRPAYAFERFGKGGTAIYDGLRRGQATLAFNTKAITEFAEKTYTAQEVKAWEKEIKEIRLGDDVVKIPVPMIMSFYELSKRPQALQHILGGGIRVATYKNGSQKISDTGHRILPEDVKTIISTLSKRQMEVADALQKYMAEQGGRWGNHVSVARFSEELFGEKEYFPINSDGRHLQATADEHPSAASLYALLNMSFTKELNEAANNRIVLYSIFDVFSNHMASMAQYNAFALPVLDALKWFNYQQRGPAGGEVIDSVREEMARVYGVPEEKRPGSGRQSYAETFVINIIKAFNGTEAQGVPSDAVGLNLLRRYNMAQVAYNFRVVLQQPLAITRAALLVDYRSIAKGMKLSPIAIKQNISEMRKYSGIAAWKALGFYDINISRGLTDIIKHDTSLKDKIDEWGMKGAEAADTLTWAAIWSACKEDVKRKQRLSEGSEGFYEAVTTLFEDVIYKTQVVDSVLTKNEFLRSKGFWTRAIGSFMSEPTTTASMLIDAYDKYNADIQRGLTRQQAWQKNSKMIGRTAYVYAIGAVMLAAVQAIADSFRDDDEYETFFEKWLQAFKGNMVDELMPLNKLPILSDVYDLSKEILSIFGVDTYGNPPQSVIMQWYDSLVKGVEILYDKITGEDTNYTWYAGIYKMLQASAGISGLPMAAATREVITAWNNTIGAMAPSLKVKSYEPGEMAEIKYAYQDGYLTDEEATEKLLALGLVDDENEAYFTIQGWNVGDGYSRYDKLNEAVLSGGDITDAFTELTSRGYTEKEILSKIKSQISTWYRDGEITKEKAEELLNKYLSDSLSRDDVASLVNEWSSEVETGIAYSDLKDEYVYGDLTKSEAHNMLMTYGGLSREDADKRINEWTCLKETGIVYDDLKKSFMDGKISETEAKSIYVTYGGYTAEEAAEKVKLYSFVKKNPECDGISIEAVENYSEYCEGYNVPAKTYFDAWKYKNSLSGTIKEPMMQYINGLNLTYTQKDSLYYAFGWKESKISDAPWH